MKVIQGSAFDGLELIENPQVRKAKMQERHQEILNMFPPVKVNPVTHAQGLVRTHGIEGATKIAKGMVHITEALPRRRENDERNLVFWKNVVGYLMKRGGEKFSFTKETLDRFHFTEFVPLHRLAKKKEQIKKQIEKSESKGQPQE